MFHWFTRKLLSYLLLAIAIYLIANLLFKNQYELSKLSEVTPIYWLLPLAAYLGALVLKSICFDMPLLMFGINVPLKDSIALSANSILSNYAVIGNSAFIFRTIYFEKLFLFSYKRYVPFFIILFILSTAIYGIIVGIAALYDGNSYTKVYLNTLYFFCGGSLITLLSFLTIMFFGLELVKKSHFVIGKEITNRLHSIIKKLQQNLKLISYWSILKLIQAGLDVLVFYLVARTIDLELSFPQAIIMVLVKECSVFIRLTPGSIGVAEGVLGIFATFFALDPSRVILANVVVRIIEIFCVGMISVILVRSLGQRLMNQNKGNIVKDVN